MGKNYRKELDSLSCIYDSAMEANVDTLTNFLSKHQNSHLYGIGSGGSYSVAAAFEYSKSCITSCKLAFVADSLCTRASKEKMLTEANGHPAYE